MTKVAVKLVHDAVLSTAIVDALPPGQAHWWLRKGSDFVRLPKRIRGDVALDLVVQLEPGSYILGVGPPRGGVREDLEVAAPAEFPKGTVESKPTGAIDVKGKSIVITGDLDSLDRDAAKAWLVSLGAKVTSAVSGNTDYLLVGKEPGPKKLEKAAELGTKIISEADLRGAGAAIAAAPMKPTKAAPQSKVKALIAKLGALDPKIEKFVGPSHFADLGMLDHEIWGIAIGARGGHHNVHIDLNDRPNWALKCNCRARNPCQHGLALLHTADRHFVPPVEPPYGHAEASRYTPGYE
jgi:hypothetical protein